jgi:intracellular multiplication protein IcmK
MKIKSNYLDIKKRVISAAICSLTMISFCHQSFADDTKQSVDAAPAPNGGMVPKKSDTEVIHEAKLMDGESTNIVKNVQDNSLTPDQITQIKAMWEAMRRNSETPAGSQPKPVVSIQNLDLSPGVTPPIVRVSDRTGVIMDFMDANGNPWPIDHVVNMSKNEIDVDEKPLDPKSDQNSFFAKSIRYGSIGNVGVYLRKLPTPIIITLLAGQKDVDYRVDFRVPAYLHGKDKIGFEKEHFDDRLAAATMGITPNGCEHYNTDTKQVMAWGCTSGEDQTMIIRVDGVLLSPSPLDGKKIDSLDGTKVYEIPTTPVVSVSVDGHVVFAKVDIKDN